MVKKEVRKKSRKREDDPEEAATLNQLNLLKSNVQPFLNAKLFSELPLSRKTLQALSKNGWTRLTDIQRAAIPHALAGRDVLGAARTGSGKTLAFLVPILEKLYRLKWSIIDGIGAIIMSPTRELALQIFNNLRKAGFKHTLSAGLIIGGKDVTTEQERIMRMNILICTPGRLLQHMDETANFACDNLQMLVLDEADRILDLGFSKDVNAIIDNLPRARQTLLFSATQTTSVRDLARLSLRDPEYVAVHEKADFKTPKKLVQNYIECELPRKLDFLVSFIKTHKKLKLLVFVSSCKQVRFIFEALKRMRPGIPLLELHGRQKQSKRLHVFQAFCNAKTACLFSTDVAARGLDFPAVDWVVQLDCPETAETYVHRVGRTARYESSGKALLVLLPSEAKMAEKLATGKIPLERIRVNPSKIQSITPYLSSLLSQDADIKLLAQKAFTSYVKSINLQSDKDVFDVHALPFEEYAQSLGLVSVPQLQFRVGAKKSKNMKRKAIDEMLKEQEALEAKHAVSSSEDGEEEGDEEDGEELSSAAAAAAPAPLPSGKASKSKSSTKAAPAAKAKADVVMDTSDSDDNEDILQMKRVNHALEDASDSDEDQIDVARAAPASVGPREAAAARGGAEEEEGSGSSDAPEEAGVARKKASEEEKASKRVKVGAKKKWKNKIRPETIAAGRVVFSDSDAEAAAEEGGADEDAPAAAPAAPVAKSSAPARNRIEDFKRSMALADVEDKKLHRERLRRKKSERKAKERAEREAAAGMGVAPTLAMDGSDGEEGAASGAEEEEEPRGAARQRGAPQRDARLGGSESEAAESEEEGKGVKRRRGAAVPKGYRPESDDEEESAGEEADHPKKRPKVGDAKDVGSLAEMALEMLKKRR